MEVPVNSEFVAPTSGQIGKNIVICCDGTGNEFGESKSNVVKLYKMLVHDDSQVAY